MKIASFYNDLAYNDDKPAIKQILETSFSKEFRILMKTGQLMKEHQAPALIIIHILKGEIDFGLNGKNMILKEGDIISLEANIPHSLSAVQDAMIRLTLLKSDHSTELKRTTS